MRISAVALGLGLALGASAAMAADYTLGDLKIAHPWSRATPKAAPAAGGFATITNTGKTADRLVAATSAAADKVEVHEMAVVDGIMKMRALPDGIEVPAGGTLELKPGSFHIMFIGPKKPFVAGDKVDAELVFEKAGKVAVTFDVQEMGAKMPAHQGHGMQTPESTAK